MEAREQKGLVLAATKRLSKRGGLWIVPSQSGHGSYAVDFAEGNCTCPDYETTRGRCKHQWAVVYAIKREVDPQGVETVTETVQIVRKTSYAPQEGWPLYNKLSCEKKKRVEQILHSVCQGLTRNQPVRKGSGRKAALIGDVVFAGLVKLLDKSSGRFAKTEIDRLHERGLIERPLAYNTIFENWAKDALAEKLEAMIQELAKPLAAVDGKVVAIDSTGFDTSNYSGWFDHKYGGRGGQRIFIKAHCAIGVNTHAVAGIKVTESVGEGTGDPSNFVDLLDAARKIYPVQTVCADAAYSKDFSNLDAANQRGITPYIPFQSNSTGAAGSEFVKKALHFFMFKNPEFKKYYHERSNVETAFSMVKRSLGGFVRAKGWTAQRNEVLGKFVVHNAACLVRAIYALGVPHEFWSDAKPETDSEAA